MSMSKDFRDQARGTNKRHGPRVTVLHPYDRLTPERRATSHLERGNLIHSAMSTDWFPEAVATAIRSVGTKDEALRTDAALVVVDDAASEYLVRWVLAPLSQQEAVGVTDYVVRSVTIEPRDRKTPAGGVTANMLRKLSPANARAAAVSAELDNAEVTPRNAAEATSARALLRSLMRLDIDRSVEAVAPAEKRKGGRPRISDELLVKVALAYLEEQPKGPGLLRRIGRRPEIDRPEATVRDWVRRARHEGYLTAARKQGSRGAAPGPRLLALQKAANEGETEQ